MNCQLLEFYMKREETTTINNAFYDDLEEGWHESTEHPIALLRSENELRNPWIQKILMSHVQEPCKILDIGCGGGFLTNFLAKQGHKVHGIDLSVQSLEIAKKHDETKSIDYQRAGAYELPYQDQTFDVVCAMNLMEHVERPAKVVAEASRVLKKDGFFFFHTFNRTFLSYFLVIKGMEWCFVNPPENIHVYFLFLKPKEIEMMCNNHGMQIVDIKGMRPNFSKSAFWKLAFHRKVDKDFSFIFTSSLKTGYVGYARKD